MNLDDSQSMTSNFNTNMIHEISTPLQYQNIVNTSPMQMVPMMQNFSGITTITPADLSDKGKFKPTAF